MELRLYNTLTRTKDVFRPIKPSKVKLYTCGPTVYRFIHIGNLRSFMLADWLRRTLVHFGYAVRQMLIALRDWWKTGVNDIGTLRPDTISPIPEGIALVEAERLAREREPGDGTAQKSVVEQLEAVLG